MLAKISTLFILVLVVDGILAETGCVDKQFIKELEGFETEGYVPKYSNGTVLGHSGVTIGNGIDLGTKDRAYFEDLGVAESIITKLEPYFGLQKQAAVDKLDETPLSLTDSEATDLSNKVMTKQIESVKTTYNNAISSDKKKWDELTDAQRTVIASVLFQYGSPTKTPTFWKHCKAQDWDKVEAELRDFGDKYPTRRKKEADHLRDDDGSNCGTTVSPPTTTTTTAGPVIEESCGSIERVDRSDWGARAAKVNLPTLTKPVKKLFIHHTAWTACTTKEACKTSIKQVQDLHMDDRGWSDIGYNFLVGEDGRGYEGRGWDKVGGHTYGYNSKAVAISVMGDFTNAKPNDAALKAVKALINCAIDAGVLSPQYEMYGHRDAACTECPGDKLYEEIKTWPKYSTTSIQKYCNKKPWSGSSSSGSGSTGGDSGGSGSTGSTDPNAGPCEKYGDIRQLKPTGAKAATAKQDGLSVTGVAASNKLLDTDVKELNKYKTCFEKTGIDLGLHPALIAAIASRESRGGTGLTSAGYGKYDSNGYGLMQCDVKTSGLDCTKYGPTSCEHINMMVKEKLIPDIVQVQNKHPKWLSRRQIQGAVAAYNFGITNVQSWERLDIGSTGHDYSNDVIARAQRLISKYGWKCEESGSSGSTPTTTPPTGSNNCLKMAEEGNCEFYKECIEKKVSCEAEGYAVGYGYKYCTRFETYYNGFDAVGKEWIDKVRICLMKELLPHSLRPGITCERIKEIAFASHVDCYTESGQGICEVVKNPSNVRSLLQVYDPSDFFNEDWKKAWSQVLKTMKACFISYGSAISNEVKELYDEGKAKLREFGNDAVDAVSDWFENLGRRKRSTSESDCEDYAQDGDCKFYECFEHKFPCASNYGYGHARDFELTHCMLLDVLKLSNSRVSQWITDFQKCMMSHLKTMYDESSITCAEVEIHMYEARVSCMVDNGYCPLTNAAEEWVFERGTNMKGFPFILPVGYTSLPLSQGTTMIDEYYYRALQDFKDQLGQANKDCHRKNQRSNANIYRLVDTKFGLLKLRTEL